MHDVFMQMKSLDGHALPAPQETALVRNPVRAMWRHARHTLMADACFTLVRAHNHSRWLWKAYPTTVEHQTHPLGQRHVLWVRL